MIKEYSATAKRRGAKKYLLSKGVKMCDMKQHLIGFLEHYGHTVDQGKPLEELLDKGALFFTSLKKYTNGKSRNIQGGYPKTRGQKP